MTLYLASPLGFSPEQTDYRNRIKAHVRSLGWEIADPWDQPDVDALIDQALSEADPMCRADLIAQAARFAGNRNTSLIDGCDALLAVLDGTEPDSGTAAEVGYACGKGRRCFGLRTDIRNMGELPGLAINLQLLHFITISGGRLFRNINEIDLS